MLPDELNELSEEIHNLFEAFLSYKYSIIGQGEAAILMCEAADNIKNIVDNVYADDDRLYKDILKEEQEIKDRNWEEYMAANPIPNYYKERPEPVIIMPTIEEYNETKRQDDAMAANFKEVMEKLHNDLTNVKVAITLYTENSEDSSSEDLNETNCIEKEFS